MNRRITKDIHVGTVGLGSNHPIAIQTMWSEPMPSKTDAQGFERLLTALRTYATMGCSIIRFSYPTSDDKEIFTRICAESPMPVVADIHFDWKLAMEALECGANKIRINPGNIGAKWKVEEVVRAAADRGAAIRIGLNGGSLPLKLRDGDHAVGMVDTALEYLQWFESWNFTNTVISLKDTDVEVTYRAYRAIASLMDYPLHLGVTEAGGVISAVARSTWVLGRLLADGIGDTMRISITDDREHEIAAAREIMRTVGLETNGIRVVSCPRCGRASFDSQAFLKRIQHRLMQIDAPLTVAIMGCQVNGPGEAAHADIAITGIGNRVYLYEKGILVREVTADSAEDVLFARLEELSHAQ
ncbi:MAG: flavodoxin-dependent (E)-4-hydroxy-3-methylbut-2-enyl-diphosphate synthase [Sphaerochaeta sp.]|jgi:(E)-4-hydroxy-3-methylbut-2-enyl-diphosphate synthase|nr:flavodoxin-dependent (E)-4-hydroxy-3-methylbut-2-enyl-diphosphate synthase [Sphaerochaeta sp.]PKL29587.1 MAG: 4-hydroxy-3-methylbut-2-en-1-yl diphosphate synthase [Spirochaetae bacterium HGW-Spirochaetae-2]